MNTQTPQQLGKSLYSGLFATRDNLHEAYDYAIKIAEASNNPVAVITAIGVLVNTLAQELMKMNTHEDGRSKMEPEVNIRVALFESIINLMEKARLENNTKMLRTYARLIYEAWHEDKDVEEGEHDE